MFNSGATSIRLNLLVMVGIVSLIAACAATEGQPRSGQSPVVASVTAPTTEPIQAKMPASASLTKSEPGPAPAVTGAELATEHEKAGKSKAHQTPIFSVWQSLGREGSEKDGYGMYTYVLFGMEPHLAAERHPEIAQQYQLILDEIIGRFKTVEESGSPKEKNNIFYIPAKETIAEEKNRLKKYDFALAKKYLSRLAGMLKDRKLAQQLDGKPGPFLISVMQPLHKIPEGDFPLLYADLSKHHPAAIAETIAAYQQHICDKTLEEKAAVFEPLKLKVLNFILIVDDNLELVRVAYAKYVPR